MSENLETLFNAARKLPLEEQRLLAEKLLDATKELDGTQDGAERSATARGQRMADALDKIASVNALSEISDPSAWQREEP